MSFAHLKPTERTKVSRKGARSLHAKKLAYKFNPEAAKKAAEKRWAKYEKEN